MSTSQRVSRGFHRLGLLLAAIPLLFGALFSLFYANEQAGPALGKIPTPTRQSDKPNPSPSIQIGSIGRFPVPPGFDNMSLQQQNEIVERLARPYWWAKFAELVGIGIALSLAVSLGLYGLIRAVGWVIGGFAAS